LSIANLSVTRYAYFDEWLEIFMTIDS